MNKLLERILTKHLSTLIMKKNILHGIINLLRKLKKTKKLLIFIKMKKKN